MNRYGVKKRGKRWQARPYVRGVGHVYADTWDTEAEAVKAALRAIDEERQLSGRSTVRAFAARWVRDSPRPKATTNATYQAIATRFAEQFGDRSMHRVTAREARAYALEHRSDISALSAMFADARREGLVLRNPFAKLRIPRGRGRRDIVVLTEEELHELADLAPAEHGHDFGAVIRAAILFAGYTGVRPGELRGLDWSDLDLDAGEAHVRRQVQDGRQTTPKSGKARTVVIAPPVAEALRAVPSRHVRCPVTGGLIVFPAKTDRRMTASALAKAWRPVRSAFEGRLDPERLRELHDARASDGPAIDLYDLRHAAATMLVERGVEAWIVAKQLGHRDGGRLVQETYGHPRDEIARERLRAIFEP